LEFLILYNNKFKQKSQRCWYPLPSFFLSNSIFSTTKIYQFF